MIRRRAQPFLALIAVLFIPFSLTLSQQNDSFVIRVSVTDKNGKPFSGLKQEDFSVTVDKTERKIVSFSAESIPASVVLLVDASGSAGLNRSKETEEFRRRISAGLTRFVAVGNPENDYFAVAFDKKCAFSGGWFRAGDSLDLNNSGEVGRTVLFDCVYDALQHLTTARHARRVILLLTDGQDNASERTFKELREAIKQSDVTVYAIYLSQGDQGSSLAMEDQGVLEELAGASGGKMFTLRYGAKPEIVNGTFDLVARDMHGQYQLTIEKEAAATPKKWRKLKLKLNKSDEKDWPKLSVKTRDGYYQ